MIDNTGTALVAPKNPSSQQGWLGSGFTGFNSALLPSTSSTKASTSSPAVVTSKVAEKDFNDIQTKVNDINTGMTNQAALTKAQEDASAVLKKETEDAAKVSAQQAEEAKRKQQETDAKTAETAGALPQPTVQTELEKAKAEKEKADADFQAAAQEVQNTIKNISNGSIPLSGGQQAQVAGLQQEFQTLIDQQQQATKDYSMGATIQGYRSGAARYVNNWRVQTIGKIHT